MKRVWLVILLVAIGACFPAPLPAEEPVALDIDYVAYETAMSVKPSAQWQAATNTLFMDWKTTLGVERLSDALDFLYLFTAETEQAALLNAVKRDHDATNNGMNFTARVGFQGDGVADYISSDYNPVADGVNYSAANASMGLHVVSVTADLDYDMGAKTTGFSPSRQSIISLRTSFSNFAVNGNIGNPYNNVHAGASLAVTSRASVFNQVAYVNGVLSTMTAGAYGGEPNEIIYVGALNSDGTASNHSPRQYGMAFAGRALASAENAPFYAAWATYLDTIATIAPPVYPIYLPIVGTNAVVQIFDRTGVSIGEILPEIDYATWRRNDIGQSVFSLAKSDPKANDTYLKAQNRVLITFDNGLPPWGGIMQPDFSIDHNRITAKAYTGEALLLRRLSARSRYFSQQTVGAITTSLIAESNAVWPLGIQLGTVWTGGDRYSPEYHYKDLLTVFKESLFRRLSAADFYAEPVLGLDGKLSFTLQVAERRGRDIPGVALHQGLNVVDPIKVDYTGPIVNRWVIIGDGDGWGSDRPVAIAEDTDSINRYGLLEDSEIHQGVIYLSTLQATADNLLAQTAWPRVLLDITAVDLPPAAFEQYDIGDNLPVELPDYGIGDSFVGAATVLARAFYPGDGRLNLVLEATESA